MFDPSYPDSLFAAAEGALDAGFVHVTHPGVRADTNCQIVRAVESYRTEHGFAIEARQIGRPCAESTCHTDHSDGSAFMDICEPLSFVASDPQGPWATSSNKWSA